MLALDISFLLVMYQSHQGMARKNKEIAILDETSIRKAYSSLILKEPDNDVLLFEYQRTQEMLQHYDNLNWQIGSILVGSNIVALGFTSSSATIHLILAAAIGGSSSLFAWILWFMRHVSIYNVKNDRLYMIERELNMVQHRMIGFASDRHWLSTIAGYKVAWILCVGLMVAWLVVLI